MGICPKAKIRVASISGIDLISIEENAKLKRGKMASGTGMKPSGEKSKRKSLSFMKYLANRI